MQSPSFGLRTIISPILISTSEITSLPLRAQNEPFQGFFYRLNARLTRRLWRVAVEVLVRIIVGFHFVYPTTDLGFSSKRISCGTFASPKTTI